MLDDGLECSNMRRTVYVNGEYLSGEEAKVSVFDRGFLFSDGVYEVTSVIGGRLIDNDRHIARLHRSLNELNIDSPCSDADIIAIQKRLISDNKIDEGLVYLQVTRGSANRDFAYTENIKPTLVMFTQVKNISCDPAAEKGATIITLPDLRWGRCDIKTIGLLYPCMAKMEAKSRGADDAWLVDQDGFISEGTSNNSWILTKGGTLVTRQTTHDILAGVTRQAILDMASQEKLEIEQRPFTAAEAYEAQEAFFTSATALIMPVITIDGHNIAGGTPGPFARKFRKRYLELVAKHHPDN